MESHEDPASHSPRGLPIRVLACATSCQTPQGLGPPNLGAATPVLVAYTETCNPEGSCEQRASQTTHVLALLGFHATLLQ